MELFLGKKAVHLEGTRGLTLRLTDNPEASASSLDYFLIADDSDAGS